MGCVWYLFAFIDFYSTCVTFNCTQNFAINIRHQLFLLAKKNKILFAQQQQSTGKTINIAKGCWNVVLLMLQQLNGHTRFVRVEYKSNPKRNFVHLRIIYAHVQVLHAVRRSVNGPGEYVFFLFFFFSFFTSSQFASFRIGKLRCKHSKTDTINCKYANVEYYAVCTAWPIRPIRLSISTSQFTYTQTI